MFVYNSFCLSSGRRKRAPFKSKGLSPKSRISCDTINNVKFSKLCLDLSINCMKMSNIPTFDSEEGYDVTKQEYYSKKRCTFSCRDCFHKKYTFRLWHILLFLFIMIVIIGTLAVIIAMFSPARGPDMKYSNKIGSDTLEGGCKGNCTLRNQQFCVIIHNCHQGGEWSKCTPLLFFLPARVYLIQKKKLKTVD